MKSVSALVALLAAYPFAVNGASYQLAKEYSGDSFFSEWSYYDHYDNLTQGDTIWVSAQNATNMRLTYVNDIGNAIIKVDNTSFVPDQQKRDSVRITTLDWFPVGSVYVIDALHIPFGCSVWPGFFTTGANWPGGGEIDIIEGVNRMTQNQMSLHTCSGCTQPTTANQTGKTNTTSCFADDGGCTVLDSTADSYGPAFVSAGGGAWAAQLDTSGVNIWFWSRADIPQSVSNASGTIDTSSWGTPSASFTTCDISNYFGPQQVVFDITFCGQEAGVPSIYAATCGGGLNVDANTCYMTNVINNGTSDYANAYFEISYVKVFTSNGQTASAPVNPPSCAIASTPSSSGAAGSPTGSSQVPGNTGLKFMPSTYLTGIAGILLVVVLLQAF